MKWIAFLLLAVRCAAQPFTINDLALMANASGTVATSPPTANMIAWWNPTTLPASGSISTWTDSSATTKTATAAFLDTPFVSTTLLNNYKGAQFSAYSTGTGGGFQVNGTALQFSGAAARSIYVVWRNTTASSDVNICGQFTAATSDVDYWLSSSDTDAALLGIHSSMLNAFTQTGSYALVSTIGTAIYTGTSQIIGTGVSYNNTGTATLSTSSTSPFTIGRTAPDGYSAGCIVHELLVYNVAHSQTVANGIQNYLKTKYGL